MSDKIIKKQSRANINSDIDLKKDQEIEIKNKIIKYIDSNQWTDILNLIKDKKFVNLNMNIDNGNNIFHIACVKGLTDFIKKIIKYKNEKKIILNTNKLNSDGLPGIHLYYKYGGADTSFFDSDDICFIDNNTKTLAPYLINRIDLLEIYVNMAIKKGCIENIELSAYLDNDVFLLLVRKIVSINNKDNKEIYHRYLNIVRILWLELHSQYLIFEAIYYHATDIIKIIMNEGFDFMIYSDYQTTPLMKAIDDETDEIALMILEYTKKKFGDYAVFKMIHASEKNFLFRPIIVAMNKKNFSIIFHMIEYMSNYMKNYKSQHNKTYLFKKELDDNHNTYLHRLLIGYNTIISNVPIQIIQFFIDHTDLNQENYQGYTCAHLLFEFNLWIMFKDQLKNKQIDLKKYNEKGINCYSFVKKEDTNIFLEFVKTIKHPIDDLEDININANTVTTNKFNIDAVKSMLNQTINQDTNNMISHKTKNFGLFNANMIHYMLYLKYLLNKYKQLFVPVRDFSEKKKIRDLFFFDLLAYELSDKHKMIIKNVNLYMHYFYSYLPHNIYWIDEDQKYISPELVDILKTHNKTVDINDQRFVMLKITIVVSENLLHANSLIYDRLNKEAWRFEPYGITNISNDQKNSASMDNNLESILTSIYGKIKYYDPDSYLRGLNFQLVDGENYDDSKNLGDPGGYCLAWSLWFIDVVLAHSDKTVKYIMQNFFDRKNINQILSEEEGDKEYIISDNYYLDFIRRYAHKLDNEKNKILISIGIKKYNFYKILMGDKDLKSIITLFEINPDYTVDHMIIHNNEIKTIEDISSEKN
jgi:hypothetical protein